MGFPLSRFQNLSALCKQESYITEQFSKYRLIAIVLHKPGNGTFKKVMSENFNRLHTTTGKGFAFITFMDPPENWAKTHGGWMELRETLIAGEGDYDNEEFLDAICERLSISRLPAVVLTDNLNSPTYAVLSTSSSKVVGQLEEIGNYASSRARRFPITSPNFIDFVDGLGEVNLKSTANSEFLSTNIADIMAVFSMDGSGASVPNDSWAMTIQKGAAKKHIKEALARSKARINELTHNSAATLEQIDSAKEIRSSYLSLVLGKEDAMRKAESRRRSAMRAAERSQTVLGESLPGDLIGWMPAFSYLPATESRGPREASVHKPGPSDFKSMMTKNSKKFYKQFQILKKFYTGQMLSEYADAEDEPEYSPVCVELCKIVEEELNASVVQLIRQASGIPMPEFYRKHCKEKGKIVIKDNYINMFDRDTQALKSNTIGGILCMLESMSQNESLAPFNGDSFMDPVRTFRNYRNDTPHPVPLGRDDFEEMNKVFDSLLKDWMSKIYDVKQNLQEHEEL